MKAHIESSNIEHATVAFITIIGLSTIQMNSPAPELSDDKLFTLQLKDKNLNIDFAPIMTLLKGKVNTNNFEDCMQSSKSIGPIPSGSINGIFLD